MSTAEEQAKKTSEQLQDEANSKVEGAESEAEGATKKIIIPPAPAPAKSG